MTEWFEEWFGEQYLHLYPHRDAADAERMIGLLHRTLPWRPGWRVLDVACGAGRHLEALTRSGAQPFGLDLSITLLRRARELTSRPLVRADMRWLPVRPRSMDLTVNLFTSFGYFGTDEEHQQALREMLRTVVAGGWFVIDFLNPAWVRQRLVLREELHIGATAVQVSRRLSEDSRFVIKTITTPEGREFMERVRLLSAADLEAMIGTDGFAVTHRFGDYAGVPLGQGPRTILVCRSS